MNDNLRKLMEEYKNAVNMSTKPEYIKKLTSNHIEDEEKSVKWNKEFVEENNKKYLDFVAKMQQKRSLEMNRVQKEIEKYIQKETKTSKEAAKYIFDFAYSEGHSEGISSVCNWIEELIELINKCKDGMNNGND